MLTPDCNKVYSEVQGAQSLLGYRWELRQDHIQLYCNDYDCYRRRLWWSVMNASCCKILLHPKYGSAVYPASMFTTAPKDVVLRLILHPEECWPERVPPWRRNLWCHDNPKSFHCRSKSCPIIMRIARGGRRYWHIHDRHIDHIMQGKHRHEPFNWIELLWLLTCSYWGRTYSQPHS